MIQERNHIKAYGHMKELEQIEKDVYQFILSPFGYRVRANSEQVEKIQELQKLEPNEPITAVGTIKHTGTENPLADKYIQANKLWLGMLKPNVEISGTVIDVKTLITEKGNEITLVTVGIDLNTAVLAIYKTEHPIYIPMVSHVNIQGVPDYDQKKNDIYIQMN